MINNIAKILLTTCGGCRQDERILFVTDDTSSQIADIMWESSSEYEMRCLVKMSDRKMHGEEPNDAIAAAMQKADVIFGITKFSLFHTDARRSAVANGARFVNMADYSEDMMREGALQADFEKAAAECDAVSDILEGSEIKISAASGTHITARIDGRSALRQYGRSLKKGASSSPPNIETAIGPIEGSARGIAVIDGSVPHPSLGVLKQSISLTIDSGRITKIEGDSEAETLKNILRELSDDNVYMLGEIGIGLNPMATLSGRMLEDEGAKGTAHFGFGGNTSFGGTIESNNHLDMVFKNPVVKVDGKVIFGGEKPKF